MSPSMKSGLVRVGTLVSILWVLIVGGITFHEGQDESRLCGASDMTVTRACHQFFWKWERPDDAASPPASNAEPDKKSQGIHVHIGKINIDVERARPLEHHLNVEHLVFGLIGPLLVIWGIGFGIAWCADGFQKKP